MKLTLYIVKNLGNVYLFPDDCRALSNYCMLYDIL